MKKSLAILLSICLVLTTIYGCFTFTAAADTPANLWSEGDFENFTTGSSSANPHYVYNAAAQGDRGWRCIGMAMGNTPQTAAKVTDQAHGGSASFGIQCTWDTRGVARQIELEAGKTYAFSFYYKGALPGGFKVLARQSEQDGEDGTSKVSDSSFWTGTNIATLSVDTTQTASDWTLVEGTFTLPEGYPVANFVLAYGRKDNVWGYIDDIVLNQVKHNYWTEGTFESFTTGSTSANPHYVYAGANQGDRGWRCVGMNAGVNGATAAKVTDQAHGGSASFGIQAYWGTRGVARQIELEAGKTYAISFYYKGALAGGFKVLARQSEQDGEDGTSKVTDSSFWTGTNIANMSVDTTQTAADWTLVEGTFTLPEGYPVANFVLAYGQKDNVWGYIDDIELYETEPEKTQLWTEGDFEDFTTGSSSTNPHYVYAGATQGDRGWRCIGMQMGTNGATAAKVTDQAHGGSASFGIQAYWGTRGVARQIELEAGKTYAISFYYKGALPGGFKVLARQSVLDGDDGTSKVTDSSFWTGTNIANMSVDTTQTAADWTLVEGTFTLPEGYPVANFVLAYGRIDNVWGYIDDIVLYETEPGGSTEPSEPEEPGETVLWTQGDFETFSTGSSSANPNYVYDTAAQGDQGWRCYYMQAGVTGARAARWDDEGHTGSKSFAVQCWWATRGVARQLELTAGKTYCFSFYYKGVLPGGVKVVARQTVQDGDDGNTKINDTAFWTGTNIANTTVDTTQTAADWTFVEGTFTLPAGYPVANFILAYGTSNNNTGLIDDFVLTEADETIVVRQNKWSQGDFESFSTGSSSVNPHYIYDTAAQGDQGWRCYYMQQGVPGATAARWDSDSHTGSKSFAVQCWWATRGVARQIELIAGSTYYFSFYYKGTIPGGVKVVPRQTIQSGDDGTTKINDTAFWTGTNIANMTADTTQTADDWTFVEGTFTLPAGYPVANFILAYGTSNNNTGLIDDFELYDTVNEYAIVNVESTINGASKPYPSFSGGNSATADKLGVIPGETVTLTASVASGCTFDGWYNGDELVSSNLISTVTVDESTTYTAKFSCTGVLNYWEGGDMETIGDKYSYIGNNIVNGENEDGWLTYRTNNYSPTRVVADDSNFHSSDYSLKLDFSGAVRALGRRFKLENGHSYKLTFWSYGSDNGFGIYNHDSATTTFECDDADNGITAMKKYATEIIRTHANGVDDGKIPTWTQHSFCFTLTEGDYVDIAWCSINPYYIDDVVLTDHTHTWGELVAETASTCTETGILAHYECTDCPSGSCGVATAEGVATNWKYLAKPLAAHTVSYHEAVAGSCEVDSNIAYYSCDVCGSYFADENATTELTASQIFTTAPGHIYDADTSSSDYHEGVERSCTTDGYEGYYKCQNCDQLFDEDGNKIDQPIVLHKYHSAQGATVTQCVLPSYFEEGSLTYYKCPSSSCINGKYQYSLTADFSGTLYNTSTKVKNAAKLACLSDDGELPIEYGGLTLEGEIGFNLYFDDIELAYTEAYGIDEATIDIYGVDAFDEDGNLKGDAEPLATLDGNDLGDEGEGAFANYRRPATPITVRADQMNDKIAIMLYDTSSGDRVPVEDFHNNGVLEITAMDILKQYIDTFENDDRVGAQEITQLSRACITYGGYATSYFNSTDYEDPGESPSNLPYDLDISAVTQETVDAIPSMYKNGAATGFAINSSSFLVLAKSAVRFYYTLSGGQEISDYTVSATIGGVAVNNANIVISKNGNGKDYIQIINIGASDLSKELVITVTNNSDSTVVEASYNALCYAKNMINNDNADTYIKNLCKAIILYSNAGDAYAAVA